MPNMRAPQTAQSNGPFEIVGHNQLSGIHAASQYQFVMSARLIAAVVIVICGLAIAAEAKILFSGEKKLNNLVSVLLEVSSISKSSKSFTFTRSADGWIFISSTCKGKGTVSVILDKELGADTVIVHDAEGGPRREAMRYVTKGEHTIQAECKGQINVEKLAVKAIPELIHCGLGFNPEIKSYGVYDMHFLKADILPNVTTLIVPSSIKLSESVIDDWHRQGKRFVAEAGIHSQGKTAEDHFKYWSSLFDKTPFLDGIIINEFIVNNPSTRPGMTISPERQKRMEQEQQRHKVFGEAIKQMRADDRHKNKMIYAYVGGSGKQLNQEMIGTNFIRTIVDCGYRVALERYLHEMSVR
jgi:hypothetical protein